MSSWSMEEFKSQRLELEQGDVDFLLPFVRTSGESSGRPNLVESITPTDEPGVYSVRMGPYIGRLQLPSGTTIDVHSRFTTDELIWLLCLAGRRPVHPDRLRASLGASRLPIDIVAAAFAREVGRLVRAGLAKGYVRERSVQPPYAGRFDTTYHLTRMAGRADRLATVPKRLTTDVPVNQVLAGALDRLLAANVRHDVGGELRHLAPVFVRVGRPPVSIRELESLTTDRLTARYEPALGLAELVIRFLATSPYGGSRAGTSTMFYMPTVWEAFVEAWVGRHKPPGSRVTTQYSFDIDAEGDLGGRADVVLMHGTRPVGIWEAKYKDPGGRPGSGDLFQMLAYCTSLGVDEVTLVYPTRQPPQSFRIGRRTIHVVGIQPRQDALMSPPPGVPAVGAV